MTKYDIDAIDLYKTYRRPWKITFGKKDKNPMPAKPALDHVSLQIEPGEAVGIIGLNGSGKSTLIKILCGIIKADQGEIHCLGYKPFSQRREYVRNIGVAFGQKSLLFGDLPLKDSLELYRVVYDMTYDEYQQGMDIVDKYFNIRQLLDQPVRKMSFGQRVRGDLAASVLHNPPLLFLDEPNIGLDVIASDHLSQYIRQRSRDGKTTILVSHNVDILSSACSRLIVLDGGVKKLDDSTHWLKQQATVDIEFAYSSIRDMNTLNTLFDTVKCKERGDSYAIISVSSNSVDTMVDRLGQSCSLVRLVVKHPDARDIISSLIAGGFALPGSDNP